MGPLDALRKAIGDAARPASDQDSIAGVPARFVAAPASVAEASEVVRLAAVHDLAVVVRGAATKQAWGAPPRRLDLILDTRRLTGVVEHAAGDLITVVRAGTPLALLQTTLAEAGQELAIDSPFAASTVGGAVAANTSGPRRLAYGTLRDLVIGVTIVRPDGVVAKSGGKVVKNVAGYDLGKLMTGSFGTLGLIAECAFRLHPTPPAVACVTSPVAGPTHAAAALAAILGAQVVPSALELNAPAGEGWEVAVRLAGVPDGVPQRADATRILLGRGAVVESTEPAWLTAYPWGEGDVGLKLTMALSQTHGLLAAVAAARDNHGAAIALRGSLGTGVLHAGLPGATPPQTVADVVDDLRAAATSAGGHLTVVTAPGGTRDLLDLWGPVPGLELMRRIKERFDPDARFAPGRFVGGI
ncbi:MAG: FAD-binding oxidoreductase [Hamadaea sp.]|nr:FAD-binding oxidoreductase [Hamadaea sp.]